MSGDVVTGEEEVEAEEVIDEKALTKRDIHTLNEQRRRDIIKVHILYMCSAELLVLGTVCSTAMPC